MSNEDHGPKDIQIFSGIVNTLIKAGADINDVDFNGNTPFLDAVESNDNFRSLKIRLESILKFGAVANTSNHRGQTALHKVASLSNSDPDLIDFLLQPSLGLDLHVRDNEGIMPIHCAASTSEINTWKFIQAGADVQAKTNDGSNPLHFAARAAQTNIIALLCKIYREKSWDIDEKDEDGRSPLHYAACSGNSESVYHLLKSGANPNVTEKQGLTPLHLCAEHRIDTAGLKKRRKHNKALYWAHRNNIPPGMKKLQPFMDRREGSPFYETKWYASWKLQVSIGQEEEAQMIQDVVRLLLSAGADLDVCDKSGQTAYDVAIFLDCEEMVDALLPLRTSADKQNLLADQWYSFRSMSAEEIVQRINIDGADAYTLLQTAICLRNEAILDSLLKAGVDPTVPGPEALTPIHTIAHWGLISMMKIVASHVKDLNIFSPPLLHVAASREQSNMQMVELLVELGVDVNVLYREVDDEGHRSTGAPVPSYAAAHILAMGQKFWNIAAFDSLCKVGADLEMTDGDGNTVLQCALNGSKSGSWRTGFWRDETLEVLLRHGANINTLSPDNGLTPLVAALESHRDAKLIQRLLDCGADITLGKVPAIFSAIESENPEVTAAVLDAGADVNAIYNPENPKKGSRGPKVETPLLSAAIKDGLAIRSSTRDSKTRVDREEIIALLLHRGANPLMELQDGQTTVLHEISHYHGLIAPILKAGVNLENRDTQNRTPLLAACSPAGCSSLVTEDESTPCKLILAGADIHATDNTGSKPLHLATKSVLFKTITLLLKRGASASAKNNARLTPLYYALSQPRFQTQLQLTKILLFGSAEPLIKGPNGETALHLLAPSLIMVSPAEGTEARERNYQSGDRTNYLAELNALYQDFVGKGCERNARDDLGNTPLFPYVKTVKYRNDFYKVEPPAEEDVRQMFGEHDVFAVNNEGDTLLHAVAGREEEHESRPDGVWLFKELISWGLDPRKENKKGVSALDVAAACGKQEILGLFAREE
jgi:ankyrin repeat protein